MFVNRKFRPVEVWSASAGPKRRLHRLPFTLHEKLDEREDDGRRDGSYLTLESWLFEQCNARRKLWSNDESHDIEERASLEWSEVGIHLLFRFERSPYHQWVALHRNPRVPRQLEHEPNQIFLSVPHQEATRDAAVAAECGVAINSFLARIRFALYTFFTGEDKT